MIDDNPKVTQRYVYGFDETPDLAPDELSRLLGGKGANLAVMAGDLGLPVPPGFTITTAVCRAFLAGSWPDSLDDELRAAMARLAERAGRTFGDSADPLLVSVRSGAPVSMPGMLDTVLNLGLNESTARGLADTTGDPDFAADCLRRFGESWRAVIGAGAVPGDPWAQLRSAIEAVFGSWKSDRAVAYRRREGIADDIGTAATVQAMVFGNRGADSGTGVLFTRNPSTGENVPYGDIMFQAQGEDVVAGTHETQPLSELETRLPVVAADLRRHCAVLEQHFADLCDVEFTIEGGRLWLLQVRVGKRSARAALRMAIEMAQDPGFPLSREEAVARVAGLLADPPRSFQRADADVRPVGVGLPASPGVASGSIVTSAAAAIEAAEGGQSVILVRNETSPEDVAGMARAAGVLTALGGLASHAAVVARGWGVPAVVGAGDVVHTLSEGDLITIDGSTGEIFRGELTGEWHVAPEVATLLGWASELRVEIGSHDAEEIAPGPGSESVTWIIQDDVLRAVSIKGSATLEQVASAVQSAPDALNAQVEGLLAEGQIESVAEQLRPTANGKLAVAALFDGDRAILGEARAAEQLEEFHGLDGRMKQIVTAWQMREVAGEQTLNDHTDAAYDSGVLDDLAVLDAETGTWLAQLGDVLPRFALYRRRLAGALELALGGDQRYVASPRVDSYHGVWFELHEDLIRVAGKKRSEVG